MGCSFNRPKSVTTTDTFQNISDQSRYKPNKIWVGKDNGFTLDQ